MSLKSRMFQYYFPDFLTDVKINRMPGSSGVVLMYHEVLPDEVSLPSWLIVRESDFKWQLSWLLKFFEVVSLDEAISRVSGKIQSKRPFAVITFDDGYQGSLKTVLPIMESIGLPFVLYLATRAVIDGHPFWYDQIINLLTYSGDVHVCINHGKMFKQTIPHHASGVYRWNQVQLLLCYLKNLRQPQREEAVRGILQKYHGLKSVVSVLTPHEVKRLSRSSCATVGCHTHGHELLDQLDSYETEKTINIAGEHILNLVGYRPQHFAYPNGNFNIETLNLVIKLGYKTAVTTLPCRWSCDTNYWRIPRLSIGRFDTKGQFKAKITSIL